MRSIRTMQSQPASIPILADDITEFHAARLLLLLRTCGVNDRITGLTKMAKLDFFVRYPQFFEVVCRVLDRDMPLASGAIESSMVRYHYGPWDQRYYQVLAFLASRNLVKVTREGNAFDLVLTPDGKQATSALEASDVFTELLRRMHSVNKILGSKSGTQLKRLIYGYLAKKSRNWSSGR